MATHSNYFWILKNHEYFFIAHLLLISCAVLIAMSRKLQKWGYFRLIILNSTLYLTGLSRMYHLMTHESYYSCPFNLQKLLYCNLVVIWLSICWNAIIYQNKFKCLHHRHYAVRDWLIGRNDHILCFINLSHSHRGWGHIHALNFELGHLTGFGQKDVSRDDISRVLHKTFNIGLALLLCIHQQMPFHLGTQNEHKQNKAIVADP